MEWKAGTENSSDLYTKNLARKELEKHERVYVGCDANMELIALILSQRGRCER